MENAKSFSEYEHYISLGGNCYVAEDLITLGLRNCAYPFDWCFSDDFSGVVAAIEHEFEDFMSTYCLAQHKDNRNRYYNEKYRLSFYHDFNKYLSLEKQIEELKKER